jgi:hypothetical protein
MVMNLKKFIVKICEHRIANQYFHTEVAVAEGMCIHSTAFKHHVTGASLLNSHQRANVCSLFRYYKSWQEHNYPMLCWAIGLPRSSEKILLLALPNQSLVPLFRFSGLCLRLCVRLYLRTYVRKYVCTCVYVCVYVCTYVCVCMYVCKYVCMRVCICACMYVYMYVSAYIYIYACMSIVCLYVHTYARTHACVHVCVFICTYCMRTHICVCVYMHVLYANTHLCMYALVKPDLVKSEIGISTQHSDCSGNEIEPGAPKYEQSEFQS